MKDMTLLNAANYGRFRRFDQRCTLLQKRQKSEVLPVGMGKGFPFPEELKSNFSSRNSGSSVSETRFRGIHSRITSYLIETNNINSIYRWAPQTSTLVPGVQLGMCNQGKTSSPIGKYFRKASVLKDLTRFRVTNVTQRAKL
jgi:hypothetical protein